MNSDSDEEVGFRFKLTTLELGLWTVVSMIAGLVLAGVYLWARGVLTWAK